MWANRSPSDGNREDELSAIHRQRSQPATGHPMDGRLMERG
jgi:hypothetical protein